MPRDITDTEMMDWLVSKLNDDNGAQKVHIPNIGWMPITREAITEEILKERGE